MPAHFSLHHSCSMFPTSMSPALHNPPHAHPAVDADVRSLLLGGTGGDGQRGAGCGPASGQHRPSLHLTVEQRYGKKDAGVLTAAALLPIPATKPNHFVLLALPVVHTGNGCRHCRRQQADSRAERRRERRQRCHPLLSAPLIRWRMALTCTAVPRRAARWAPASRSAGFATVSAIPAGRRRVTQICNRLQTVAASNERQWRPPCCARLCKAGGHPKAH